MKINYEPPIPQPKPRSVSLTREDVIQALKEYVKNNVGVTLDFSRSGEPSSYLASQKEFWYEVPVL